MTTKRLPFSSEYDDILRSFARGEKQWYFRTAGTVSAFRDMSINCVPQILEFEDVAHIPMVVEGDFQKMADLMCERPGRAIASLYEVCLHLLTFGQLEYSFSGRIPPTSVISCAYRLRLAQVSSQCTFVELK